ncbi:MAG: family transposase, partial [Rhodospirillales bacterium]|nr:family transposase [Rhodospirillales bacterium]
MDDAVPIAAPAPADALSKAQRRIADLERKIGRQQVELDFFSASLAAGRGGAPDERRAWRRGVYAVIQAMSAPLSQGEIGIDRMCQLAGVSRAGYYRHWQASAPRQEETGLRDMIQTLALAHRHYGHRRIAALLHRAGWPVNHKRVLRL